MSETFIGRTIVGVERPHDYCWLLRLDDGTAVEFLAQNDETTLIHLTDEVIAQRAIDAERERREREERVRRQREASERMRVHVEQMRTELDPKAFDKWRRETYPTMAEIIKDEWSKPMTGLMGRR